MADALQMKRVISIALALICTSCAPLSTGVQHFGQAISICYLVGDEQKYAGQQVLVTGLLAQTPHGREIYSPECKSSVELRGSSDLWNNCAMRVIGAALANDKIARVPVVVSGVFQPWVRYENGNRIINTGGPYIEQAQIVAARQP